MSQTLNCRNGSFLPKLAIYYMSISASRTNSFSSLRKEDGSNCPNQNSNPNLRVLFDSTASATTGKTSHRNRDLPPSKNSKALKAGRSKSLSNAMSLLGSASWEIFESSLIAHSTSTSNGSPRQIKPSNSRQIPFSNTTFASSSPLKSRPRILGGTGSTELDSPSLTTNSRLSSPTRASPSHVIASATSSSTQKNYIPKLYRMVSPDSRTDIMPEPFEFIKNCTAMINNGVSLTPERSNCSESFQKTSLASQDLQTLLCQLVYLRMQMITKMQANTAVEEQDLIKSWQLIYEAEEKESELRVKERMAADIINAHNQLKAMDSLVDKVMADVAVPFRLLNSYVGLTESYDKSVINAKTVKRINETLASNNDYSSRLLELERAVRSIELLAEKQNMLLTNIASKAASPISSGTGGKGKSSPLNSNHSSVSSPILQRKKSFHRM